jgi:hypothetical protein
MLSILLFALGTGIGLIVAIKMKLKREVAAEAGLCLMSGSLMAMIGTALHWPTVLVMGIAFAGGLIISQWFEFERWRR